MDNPTNQMSDQRALVDLLLGTLEDTRAGAFLIEAASEAVKEITTEIAHAEGVLDLLKRKRTTALALAGRLGAPIPAPEEERPEMSDAEAREYYRKHIAAEPDNLKAERKLCSLCVRWLPYGEFHRASAAKDGLRAECKTCRTETRTKDAEAVDDAKFGYFGNGNDAHSGDPAVWSPTGRLRRTVTEVPEYCGHLTEEEQAALLRAAPAGAVLPYLDECPKGHAWVDKTSMGSWPTLGWGLPTQHGLYTARCRECQHDDNMKHAMKVGI